MARSFTFEVAAMAAQVAGQIAPLHLTVTFSWMLLGSHTIDAKAYLIPITIESGPASGSTRVAENPASFIQPAQSAPV